MEIKEKHSLHWIFPKINLYIVFKNPAGCRGTEFVQSNAPITNELNFKNLKYIDSSKRIFSTQRNIYHFSWITICTRIEANTMDNIYDVFNYFCSIEEFKDFAEKILWIRELHSKYFSVKIWLSNWNSSAANRIRIGVTKHKTVWFYKKYSLFICIPRKLLFRLY